MQMLELLFETAQMAELGVRYEGGKRNGECWVRGRGTDGPWYGEEPDAVRASIVDYRA